VIELTQNRVGIAIGDVVGHGVRAAAVMGQLRTALRAYALEDYAPGQVLEQVDRLLQSIRGRSMATAAYGIFDPEDASLCLSSAGHLPPVVMRPDEPPRLLDMELGPPLGAMPYASYGERATTLDEDELVLLYTDGLVEVRGEPIDRGLDRLLAVVAGSPSPEHACRKVVRELVPREGASDDIAFVALQNEAVPDELLLYLPTVPPVLTQVRQSLRRWMRARGATKQVVDAVVLACGEACANAIEHAYSPNPSFFTLEARADGDDLSFAVRDHGHWRPPRGQNRGRGLSIMEALMDSVEVKRTRAGTEILMRSTVSGR
jgi:anti-sigma regulatory factor (Ser/Thr protein kinase)